MLEQCAPLRIRQSYNKANKRVVFFVVLLFVLLVVVVVLPLVHHFWFNLFERGAGWSLKYKG